MVVRWNCRPANDNHGGWLERIIGLRVDDAESPIAKPHSHVARVMRLGLSLKEIDIVISAIAHTWHGRRPVDGADVVLIQL